MQYISYQYRWIQVSTEETLKTIRRLEIRELLTHMRNDFDGFIYRCDTEKEIISELEHVSVKTLQTKRQSESKIPVYLTVIVSLRSAPWDVRIKIKTK